MIPREVIEAAHEACRTEGGITRKFSPREPFGSYFLAAAQKAVEPFGSCFRAAVIVKPYDVFGGGDANVVMFLSESMAIVIVELERERERDIT